MAGPSNCNIVQKIRRKKSARGRPPINSHQLRKRAFTAAWQNNIDPRKAAIAYACNVNTVMKHYVMMDEQAVTDEVTNQLADVLAPKPKGNSPKNT